MLDGRKLWLFGCGNMGGAMLARWIASEVLLSDQVTVVDPRAPEVPAGISVLAEMPYKNDDYGADIVVLAVKPQQIAALGDYFDALAPKLLISIIAGVEEATLSRLCGATTTIRAMPNLPVSLGRGVIALHSADADDSARATAEALMAPLGLVEWIADEALFHAVTALSGSGPGFVYRFIEAMTAAGAALGLPADQAQGFAIATVEGAAALAAASGETPAALANRVASPGGTTRAGLDVLDEGEAMKALVAATLTAAARRSEELASAAR